MNKTKTYKAGWYFYFGFILFIISNSYATTFNVPSEYSTIQEAIENAIDGDSILVNSGTYNENINYLELNLYISSISGAEQTKITSVKDSIPVVQISNSGNAVLNGFSITGSRYAPGILTYESSTTISNCDIYNCQSRAFGGGIYVENQITAKIINNKIHNNYAKDAGGGLYVSFAHVAVVSFNEVYENEASRSPGMETRNSDRTTPMIISYNNFYRNVSTKLDYAYQAVFLSYAEHVCFNNTIVMNTGGLKADGGEDLIHSNIIAFNEVSGFIQYPSPLIKYNCLYGNGPSDSIAYVHGINEDPLFIDTTQNNFALSSNSHCINSGNPDSLYNNDDGTPSDIGAIPFQQSFPISIFLKVNEGRQDRIINHSPLFVWSYYDTTLLTQTGIEFQVSSNNLFNNLLWDYSNNNFQDTSLIYSGNPLLEGEKYYVRMRVSNSSGYGSWVYKTCQMNLIPPVPLPKAPIDSINAGINGVQLRVDTVYSLERDTITYDFELYADSLLTNLVFFEYDSDLFQSQIIDGLNAGVKYWWRSRTFDNREYSDWCEPATFSTRESSVINVPSEYSTIQEALNIASQGDTILLAPGVYYGDGNRDLQPGGRAVVLMGSGGAENTIIDCQASELNHHRAINVILPLSNSLVIEGITFKNGFFEEGGGAIRCIGSPLQIRDCIFRANGARWGGALYTVSSLVLIENSIFDSNYTSYDGAAIYGLDGGSIISNSSFVNHHGRDGSVLYSTSSQTIVEFCNFENNTSWKGSIVTSNGEFNYCKFISNTPGQQGNVCSGGKIYRNNQFLRNNGNGFVLSFGVYGSIVIEKNTFYGNNRVIALTGAYANIKDCIIAYNQGDAIKCYPYQFDMNDPNSIIDSYVSLNSNNIFGNSTNYDEECASQYLNTNGNILQDPIFCDTTLNDLKISSNSPCFGTAEDGGNMGGLEYGCTTTDIESEDLSLPTEFSLSQNYPNPFNPTTIIEYSLPTKSNVYLSIYNLLGQEVKNIVNIEQRAGTHKVYWDGTNNNGVKVSSGIYLYKIVTDSYSDTKKMLLLK